MPRSRDPQLTLTTSANGRVEQLRLRVALLRVIQGPDKGAALELKGELATIGSHPSCDLALSDRTVSARHAEVLTLPTGYLLRDLGAKNGVYVNDLRAERVHLAAGALVQLGKTLIEVLDGGRIDEVALSATSRFGRVRGASVAMRRVYALLEPAARSDATLLIEGETGTGKGLIAEEVHRASARADSPFEVFDCGAVQPDLIDSALFGHERGAFTGAVETHAGAVERAEGGSLLLDEIGELPLALQPKLLRLLESRKLLRVGARRARGVSVRFIAATNRRLDRDVAAGRFRQDLFFRLAVMRVTVPPLRERLDDLPALVEGFCGALPVPGAELQQRLRLLYPLMSTYSWPGNVRELRNVVERIAVLRDEDALPTPLRGAASAAGTPSYHEARELALEQFERLYLASLLEQTGGNVTRAAELAQVSRRYVTLLMAKHQISRRGGGRRRR